MEKNNTGMKVAIIILCLLAFCLAGYIVYDKVLSGDNELINNDNSLNENNMNKYDDNCNIKLQNYQEISLADITVKVENGNINFTSGDRKTTFSSVNAKYVYLVPYMDTANARLYYITENDELYYTGLFPFEKNAFFNRTITNYGVKIANNVSGFIGNQAANNYDFDGNITNSSLILNVLLNDGSVYSVGYESK